MSLASPSTKNPSPATSTRLILNHNNGDTIYHSLVLLEGQFVSAKDECSSMELAEESEDVTKADKKCSQIDEMLPESDKGCSSTVDQISESAGVNQEMNLLVNHNGSCQSWPVIRGKFKAFVKLHRGINKLKILCPPLQYEQSFTLTCLRQENQPRFVRIVYIKCSDSEGKFNSPDDSNNDLHMAIKKLCFNAQLLQTFTACDMHKHGFGFQTFQLEEDKNGEVVVHVFDTKLTTEKAHGMTGDQLYGYFLSELTSSSLQDANCKFLAFMSCTHYDPPEAIDLKQITKYVKAHTALGGGQLGLFGTGGLHTWAHDVQDLVKCFTDKREIDKTKLFDDSAGRGTFWANYSTTLGAALHELGHCFDLAHTPEGIMGRGFDDMNHFATVSRENNQLLSTTEMVNVGNDLVTGIFADHKAHWYRSSAVALHYNKWYLGGSNEDSNQVCLQANWSSHVKGPVGNGGGGQKNQSYFDDVKWCNSNGLVLSGYAVYHSDYINALKPITVSQSNCSTEEHPVHGKLDDKCSFHIFPLEDGEYFTSVEVRAGAWIDGIRFHSNMKSSIWFGGRGGNWNHLKPREGEQITGIFGTFGDYVGSLGIHVSERPSLGEPSSAVNLQIESNLGIRLIELRNKDEVMKFWEFCDENPPTTFDFPFQWCLNVDDFESCSIFVEDSEGNICLSGFVGFEKFIGGTKNLNAGDE